MDKKQELLREEQIRDELTVMLISVEKGIEDIKYIWTRWDREKKRYNIYSILETHVKNILRTANKANVVFEDWKEII